MKLTQQEIDEQIENSQLVTEQEFEMCMRLDSMGQLHLVDEHIRHKFLSALRAYEIWKAGIPIKNLGVSKETENEHSLSLTDSLSTQTLLSRLCSSDLLHDEEGSKETLVYTSIGSQLDACDDDGIHHSGDGDKSITVALRVGSRGPLRDR